MTGSVMVMLASGGLVANSFGSTLSNTNVTTPATYGASITFNADGTSTGNHASGVTNWYFPTTTGIGSQFWAKVAVSSQVNTTLFGTINTSSWTQLTTGANFGVQNSSTSLEGTGNYVISIATDSAGGRIVGTVSGNWDVGYTP